MKIIDWLFFQALTSSSVVLVVAQYEEPPWWPLIEASFDGVNLQRCRKRSSTVMSNQRKGTPSSGQRCARRPKTCFFGLQDCFDDDGVVLIYPETMCICNARRVWQCDPVQCPPGDAVLTSPPPSTASPPPLGVKGPVTLFGQELFPENTTYIDLEDFGGSIPSLGIEQLTRLTFLFFDETAALTGTIPTTIGLWTQLESLGLDFNFLTGSIPTEIGLLTLLESLYLSGNSLEGSIPTEIGLLTGLVRLRSGQNALVGSIPTEIGLLRGLEDLFLFQNSLEGSIPTEIGLLTGLGRLQLGGNSLEGSIPTEIGQLKNISVLSLSDNSLSGAVPSEALVNLVGSSSVFIGLCSSSLSGSIPAAFCSEQFLNDIFINCDGEIDCECCISCTESALCP